MTQTQEKLGSHEVLRVTSDGQFIWHPEADVMLEEGDFSHAPAMPHILKALRKQRTWVGLRWSDVPDQWCGNAAFIEGGKWAEKTLKEKNT